MHHWIDTPEALSAYFRHKPARIGLDTEFVRERTYWPKLALVQISIHDEGGRQQLLLVDALAPGMPEALRSILADTSILKVMHSASEDLIALKHDCGSTPQPLFDTQVAAALAGIGAGIGYQKLVQQLEGVTLEKGETRSDWLRRPLSASQQRYAAEDVQHLLALHDALGMRLHELGRDGWLAQDGARAVGNAERDPVERWPHLPLRMAQDLDAPAQHRLLRLLRWRDQYARTSDRPRSWILENDLAVALARQPPATADALQAVLDATPKAPRKLGHAIWTALTTPLDDETSAPLIRTEELDKHVLRRLQQTVAQVSADSGLPDGVLASRRWLEHLMEHGQWPDALEGWRRQLLEPRLTPLLSGAGADQGASV